MENVTSIECQPKSMALTRRSLAAILMASPLISVAQRAAAQTAVPKITQNVVTFGADATGNTDSAPAFRAAFAALPVNGGSIYVPDGDFRLDSPLVFGGKGVTVYGNGEQATRIFITHSGIALSFNQPSPLFMTCVKDLGISAVGSVAQCAISISYPEITVFGSQTALIENVSVPSPIYGASPNFLGGLCLQGCWQSVVRNFKHLAPGGGGPTAGSYFVAVGGRSIDVRFEACTGQNSDLGFWLVGYTEGIHLQNCAVVSSNYGLTMASASIDSFEGNPQYFSLGLTVSDCEIVAHKTGLLLNRVLSGYITNSHIGLAGASTWASAITIIDSQDVKISNSTISGQSGQVGLSLLSYAYPCAFNQANDCFFTGLSYAVIYSPNVTSNVATNIRVCQGGSVSPNFPSVWDGSGNQTNNMTWMNSNGHVTALH